MCHNYKSVSIKLNLWFWPPSWQLALMDTYSLLPRQHWANPEQGHWASPKRRVLQGPVLFNFLPGSAGHVGSAQRIHMLCFACSE